MSYLYRGQQKSMGFGTFLMLFIFLFSFSVSANTDWTRQGNANARFGSNATLPTPLGDLFYGSNFPSGNTNFSQIQKTIGNDINPIIDDLNNDGFNEVVIFDGNVVTMYDSSGNIIDDLTLNGTVCGSSTLAFPKKTGDPQSIVSILVVSQVSTQFNFNVIQLRADNSLFVNTTNSKNIGVISSCAVFHNLDIAQVSDQNIAWIPMTNNSIIVYDLLDGSKFQNEQSPPEIANNILGMTKGTGDRMNSISDFDNDNDLDLTWVYITGGTTDIMVYDTGDDSYRTSELAGSDFDEATPFFAQIGSPSNFLELIVAFNVQSSNANILRVYDSSFTQAFEITFSSTNDNFYTVPSVADITQNGGNELCTISHSGAGFLKCYDSSGSENLTRNMSLTTDYNVSLAIGEYIDGNNFLEVMTYKGVYNIGNVENTNLSLDTSFGVDNNPSMKILPVSIQSQSTFLKDIFLYDNSLIVFLIGEGVPAVCGNFICESGETVFNCFIDCGSNETVTGQPVNALCDENSDCASKNCNILAKRCVGLASGIACTVDLECDSGDCDLTSGLCNMKDIKKNVDDMLEITGWTSTGSKILFALIVIAVFAVSFTGFGGLSGGSVGAVIGLVIGVVVGLMIDIVVFGWMGVWIAFFLLFLVLAGIVFTLFFGSKGGG